MTSSSKIELPSHNSYIKLLVYLNAEEVTFNNYNISKA